MCRLFALHAGAHDVTAQLWLLDAPDSLAAQSEVNADGFGLGALTTADGLMLIRTPVQATEAPIYDRVAHEAHACQFLAHLRYADTGFDGASQHPPVPQGGRLFAHNGIIGDLDRLEERLGDSMAMVAGETDSERFFALITKSILESGGDTEAGIEAAVRELAEGYGSTASTSSSGPTATCRRSDTPSTTSSSCSTAEPEARRAASRCTRRARAGT